MSTSPPPAGSNPGASIPKAPVPGQGANVTGYTPPAGADEVVEELAEEIADEVVEDAPAVQAQAAAAPPVVPVTPGFEPQQRTVYTAPPPPPPPAPGFPPAPVAPLAPAAADEVIEDAVVSVVTPAAAPAAPAEAHPQIEVDLDAFSSAVNSAPKARPKPLAAKAGPPPSSLKSTSVPILFTVGLLLLWPGGWSVLLKMGKITSERTDAQKMANLFLICLPMGVLLMSAAVYFFIQIRDEAKARRERHEQLLQREAARAAAEQAAQLKHGEQQALLQQQAAQLAAVQRQLDEAKRIAQQNAQQVAPPVQAVQPPAPPQA